MCKAGWEVGLKYRSDIDGLRAVAVLLVLMFHGGLAIVPSGFIGVDIFFVISGFLISGIINASLEKGDFNFARFYARRLWRLQPAVVLLLLVTFVVATVLYLPDDYVDYLKSAKYTALITSNQYFERVTTSYAAPDSAWLLLLHTWSLSIEWQWYLLLPIGLWVLHRFCPLRFRTLVIAFLTAVAIVIAMVLSKKSPEKSYYFFSSRVFEFLIGVTACSIAPWFKQVPHGLKSTLGVASLAVLVYVASLKGILSGFPDWHAVLVCVAAAALLVIGEDRSVLSSRVLTLQPLVFVGTISYSLYLWHWPVFATGRYLGLDSGWLFALVCFLLTGVLAFASYVLVENKYRRRQLPLKTTAAVLCVAPLLVFVGLYSLANKHDGIPGRFGKEYASIIQKLKSSEEPYRQSCLGGSSDGTDQHCIIGAETAENRSLLMGDSFSNQYWGFMDVLGKDANASFLVQGTSSCLALPDVYLFDWWNYKGTVYSECHNNAAKYYGLIKSNHYKYVAIGEMWGNYEGDHVVLAASDPRSVELSHERIERALHEALDLIVSTGATPIILKATATMPEHFQECFFSRFKLRSAASNDECGVLERSKQSGWFDELFVRLKKKYPSLVVVDPKEVQCGGDKCMVDLNGVPVYRDVGHITDYASRKFGEMYLEKLGNPLLKLEAPALMSQGETPDSE